jgi:predicted nucleotidyltransferase
MEPADPGDTAIQEVPPEEEFSAYLPHIRRRWEARREEGERRRQEAWEAARQVAGLLRSRFGAERIVAFGSLVHPGLFSEHSDVDLAVSGIAAGDFFKAWAVAGHACRFQLDLVDLHDCSPALRHLIEEEGVEL